MNFAKIAMSLAALCAGAICTTSTGVFAQERVIALKGGDTLEVFPVWYVKDCKSVLAAAPTVEILEGPPQVKMWVEPAMVVASRLKCTVPVTGGKLMAKIGTIEQKTDAKVTFRVVYPTTTAGIQYVARVYNVSFFPGEATPGAAEPSRSWKDFLASVELPTRNDASRSATPSSSGTSRSARKILKKHKLIQVASADQAIPKGLSREALYTSCRRGVYKKYSWDGHDGKRYMERQIWIGMTDSCVAHGGQVP